MCDAPATTDSVEQPPPPQQQQQQEQQQPLRMQRQPSLQEAFARFRQQKLGALRNETFLKRVDEAERGREERMQYLRRRFIETAKSYVGVPYHRRYHAPDTPTYNSPLFLDCCGLVRQCVKDLKEEFGFTLGRWNQAYQFDTLPLRKASHEELQPGDLIFYAGTYYNTRCKRQKHDMVHVEIYLGGETGEQSIGARWQRGAVQVFDSYKFESKLYHDVSHFYCSIDTWLLGVCKSFCAEHDWTRPKWLPGKKSVFAIEDADAPATASAAAGASMSAGDAGVDEDDDEEQGEDADAYDGNDDDGGNAQSTSAPRPTVFAKGNGAKLITAALGERGWAVLPEQYATSTEFTLKWVESRAKIDYLHLRDDKQLVNHIPNCGVITSKANLLQTLRDYEREHADAGVLACVPETYRLDQPTEALRFFARTAESASAPAGTWVLRPVAVGGGTGAGVQIVRDLGDMRRAFLGTGSVAVTDDDRLVFVANPAPLAGQAGVGAVADAGAAQPLTPSAGDALADVAAGAQAVADVALGACVAAAAVQAPAADVSDSGSGTASASAAAPAASNPFPPAPAIAYADLPLLDHARTHELPKTLAQRYVERPVLLRGCKTDLRAFVLVASLSPFLALFRPGYARVCAQPYDVERVDDRFAHVTNLAVQRKHAAFDKSATGSSIAFDRFVELAAAEGTLPASTSAGAIIAEQRRILAHVLRAAQPHLRARRGMFELLAADFILDQSGKLWLLELSANPSFTTDTDTLRDLMPVVARETLDIVLEVFEKQQMGAGAPIAPLEAGGAFSVLVGDVA